MGTEDVSRFELGAFQPGAKAPFGSLVNALVWCDDQNDTDAFAPVQRSRESDNPAARLLADDRQADRPQEPGVGAQPVLSKVAIA